VNFTAAAVEESVAMLDHIMQVENDPANPDSLVKEAAQGHLDVVREIINRHPDQVGYKSVIRLILMV